VDAVIFRGTDALTTPPTVAVISELPTPTPVANPELAATVATDVFDEAHAAAAVRF
jgi:hypothetical protein